MCNSIYSRGTSRRPTASTSRCALTGQITADQYCDTIIAAIKEAQKS
jgi:hypothetical protein